MCFRFGVIVALSLCAVPCFTQAQLFTPIQQLMNRLKPIHRMQAHFQQVVRDVDGEVLQKSEGQMLWQRPEQFYWQIESPQRQLMVANGRVVWIYTPSLAQATKRPMPALSSTPVSLLSGSLHALEKQFSVRVERHAHGAQVFVLHPKMRHAGFQSIELVFIQQQLQSMRFVDQMDQLTTIVFSAIQMNHPISTKQFTFVPPSGVDVVDSSESN